MEEKNYTQPDESEFVVVEFYEEKDQDIVPISVISSDWIFVSNGLLMCYWPQYFHFDKQRERSVRNHLDIDKKRSKICPIIVKYSSESYEEAFCKLTEIENQRSSEMESEIDDLVKDPSDKRVSKKNKLYDDYDDFNTSSEEIPECRLPKKNKISYLNAIKTPRRSPRKMSPSKVNTVALKAVSKATRTLLTPTSRNLFTNKQSATLCTVTSAPGTSGTSGIGHINSQVSQVISGALNKNYSDIDKTAISLNAGGVNISEDLKNSTDGVGLDLLRQLIVKTQKIDAKVSLLLRQRKTDETDLELLSEFKTLKTVNDVKQFEKRLENIDVFSEAIKTLSFIGGKDTDDTTRKILSTILSHSLSLKFNWTGRYEKEPFCKYKNVNKLILVAVRKNVTSANASQLEVEKATKAWLRNAYDRGGGRKNRVGVRAGFRAEDQDLEAGADI